MDPGSVPRIDGASVERLLAERDWLLALARRLLRDDGAAHDVAQDALIAAIERPLASTATPRAFLATVIRRAAAKLTRGDARRRAREERAASSDRLPDAAQLAAEAETRRAVVDAVLELPEPYRRTVLLRFFRAVPSAVIAKEEGVTAAAIDTRVFRAMSMLRARLDSHYGDRMRWSAPLLAATKSWSAAKVTGSALTGGLVMHAAGKVGIAAGIVFAVVIAIQSGRDGSPSTQHDESSMPVSPRIAAAVAEPNAGDAVERESVVSTSEPILARAEARVAVVDATGAPLPFARLIVERGGTLETHRADDTGRCVIDASEPSAAVAVTASSHPPQRIERLLASGEHLIELAPGSELSGLVRVDGEQPDRPVRVFFDYTAASMFEWSQRARTVTAEGFEFLETWSDESGAFRFLGLPEDAHGDLRVDEHRYRFVHGEEARTVLGPTTGIVLDVASPPRLIGRIVDSTGVPLDEAQVYVRYGPEDSDPIATRIESTDENGRFEHWLPIEDGDLTVRPWIATVRIGASDRVREAERVVELRDAAIVDLGDVSVSDAVATTFRCVDERGSPLPGVVAIDDEYHLALCEPTDAAGQGVLLLGAPVDRVFFAAVDREIVAVDIERGQPTIVTLPRAASLSVSIRRANGERPKLAWIEIESRAGNPFAVPEGEFPIDSLPSLPGSFREPTSEGGVITDSRWKTRYEIRDGAATIRRLRPGVAIDVRAYDGAGREIEARVGIVLAAGETRSIEFTRFATAYSLALSILAPDRKPVGGAMAYVLDANGDLGPSQFSAPDGSLRFDEVESDRVEVVIYSPRFATTRVSFERLADDTGRPREVILEPGRRVELRIVDSGGHPVEALTDVFAGTREDGSDLDSATFARGVSDGRYVFEDLPPRVPIWFFVDLGGRRFAQVHDSPAGDATLVVPEHGSLAIEYDFAPATNYVPRLQLTESRTGEMFEIEFPDFAPRPGDVVFPYVPQGRYTVSLRSAKDDEFGADRVLGVVDGVVEVLAQRTTKIVARRP